MNTRDPKGTAARKGASQPDEEGALPAKFVEPKVVEPEPESMIPTMCSFVRGGHCPRCGDHHWPEDLVWARRGRPQ